MAKVKIEDAGKEEEDDHDAIMEPVNLQRLNPTSALFGSLAAASAAKGASVSMDRGMAETIASASSASASAVARGQSGSESSSSGSSGSDKAKGKRARKLTPQVEAMLDRLISSIFESYFRVNAMNESKIRSYNRWVIEGLPQMIKNASPFTVKYTHDYHVFDFDEVTMNKPIMTETDSTSHILEPKEARLRNETYAANVYVHIRYRVYQMPVDVAVPTSEAMSKGKLTHDSYHTYVKFFNYPVLLKSVLCHLSDGAKNYGECNSDVGGYFIIDGQEKMLMNRERLAYDKLFLHPLKEGSASHMAEFRSSYYDQFKSTQTLKMELSRATKTEAASLYIQMTKTVSIPWVTFMRALGIAKAKDICTMFRFVARDRWNDMYSQLFKNSLKNHQGVMTRQAALRHIGRIKNPSEKDVTVLEQLGLACIRNRFLPNMNTSVNNAEDDYNKAFALCVIGCRLIDYAQDPTQRTNKDLAFNKQSESCEDLLGPLTRQFFVAFLASVKLTILKKLKDGKTLDIQEVFGDDKVGKGMKEALASGVWHATKGKGTQTGVSQKYDRANYVSAQAQQMKLINHLRKEVKQVPPRLLSSTSYGVVCPSDSPEGATCGLVKFNAILQHQSIGTDGSTITHLLHSRCGVIDLTTLSMEDMRNISKANVKFVVVNVNGRPIGIHDDALEVAQFVREYRRDLAISPDTSVSYTNLSVDIRTDRGRNLRPLFVAQNLHKLATLLDGKGATEGAIAPFETPFGSAGNAGKDANSGSGGNSGSDAREECIGHATQGTQSPRSSQGIQSGDGTQEDRGGSKGGASPLTDPIELLNFDVKWSTLLSEGIIEYIDKEEEQNLVFANNVNDYLERTNFKSGHSMYTHIEIHGSVFYGVSASLIPFPNHNQSPRNTYQCAMIRQAQGSPSSNAKSQRMDSSFMEMWYAQRPLVETQVHKILNCHKFPYGQNVLVAIISMGDHGQEDASITNQAAIDFGMLRSSVFRTTTISEKKQGKTDNNEEFIKIPEEQLIGRRKAAREDIEADGLLSIGARVDLGTALAQKAIKQSVPRRQMVAGGGGAGGGTPPGGIAPPVGKWKDMVVTSLNNKSGNVDKIALTSTACGIRTAKIRVVRVAVTKEGDKFATRYGQKGVNGCSKPSVDLVFTEDGIMPHFIINCLAFSSRMTWGEWIETLLATVALDNGIFGDATPFSRQYANSLYRTYHEKYHHLYDPVKDDFVDDNARKEASRHIVDEISAAMVRLGLDPDGEHVLYSGTNGKRLQGRIFMGYTYLQKLKHMVEEKIRARGRGKVHAQLRQAVEGRVFDGGLKFGEMEKDCLIAHGAAFNVQDRMCLSSDPKYLHICKICKCSVLYDQEDHRVWCQVCDKFDTAGVVLTSATFNLTLQELQACNIDMRFTIEEIGG